MKFWEDFFSTDKIIYPAISAFVAGFLLCAITMVVTITITDFLIAIVMGAGFLIGNVIKVEKIQAQRLIEEKINALPKKKKKKSSNI